MQWAGYDQRLLSLLKTNMPEPTESLQTVSRRTVSFVSQSEILDDVDRLESVGYQQAGNWTLGQVCNHLAEAIEMTLRTRVPGWVERPFVAVFFKLQFLGRMGSRLGWRMPTTLPQRDPIDDQTGRESLKCSLERLEASDRAGLVRFHLWHSQHHLSFLVPNTTPSKPDA